MCCKRVKISTFAVKPLEDHYRRCPSRKLNFLSYAGLTIIGLLSYFEGELISENLHFEKTKQNKDKNKNKNKNKNKQTNKKKEKKEKKDTCPHAASQKLTSLRAILSIKT